MKTKLCTFFSIFIILLPVLKTEAQEVRTVSGVVTAFENTLLKKVKVSASKSGDVTATDSAGRYSLKVLKNDVITFSAAGFKEKIIKTGTQKLFKTDLTVNTDEASLKDAVSNGHISMETLQQKLKEQKQKNVRDFSKYTSIFELISNEVYEVRVIGTRVANKKVKSFDSSPQVLYVVNDKIVSDISYINPSYVSKIEFIDDVGASMWGMSGANGVLKITLK
jgi:intergrase/recombinase